MWGQLRRLLILDLDESGTEDSVGLVLLFLSKFVVPPTQFEPLKVVVLSRLFLGHI